MNVNFDELLDDLMFFRYTNRSPANKQLGQQLLDEIYSLEQHQPEIYQHNHVFLNECIQKLKDLRYTKGHGLFEVPRLDDMAARLLSLDQLKQIYDETGSGCPPAVIREIQRRAQLMLLAQSSPRPTTRKQLFK